MNTERFRTQRPFRPWLVALAALLVSGSLMPAFGLGAPVRLSFKFILNAQTNRPGTGNFDTDEEIIKQVELGNAMFRNLISELRFENHEIVDAAGISQWYFIQPEDGPRDALRAAAIADPVRYHWRTDAINIYISGTNGIINGGISKFPPDNDIIILAQNITLNTVAHEVGHSLNLSHTHQAPDDGCSDTLADDKNWTTRNEIAQNAFGKDYPELTASQQAQVNLVWYNLMSYHNGDDAFLLSSCQMDRISSQAYDDRSWLLTKEPVYVDGNWKIAPNGSFSWAYETIQQAIDANALNNKVLVLEHRTHSRPTSHLKNRTEVITRKGASLVQCRPAPYTLPAALEESANLAVRQAVVRAQQADRRKDKAGAITHLVEAERHATGREKQALQHELAQRFRDSNQPDEATAWFKKLAAETDQPALRERALRSVDDLAPAVERQRRQREAAASQDAKQ